MSVVFTLPNDPRQPPVERCLCPKCARDITEALGPVNSSLDWFRCVMCRHIWARPPLRTD